MTLIQKMMAVSSALGVLKKTKEVKGKSFSYMYLPLPELQEILKPECEKVGIGFTHVGIGSGIKLIIEDYETKEVRESWFDYPKEWLQEIQDFGKATTYVSRYLLLGAFELEQVDNDGAKEVKKLMLSPNLPNYQQLVADYKAGKITMAALEAEYIVTPQMKVVLDR